MSDWKETEIGLIPKDWDYIPFKQILSEPTRNGIYKSKEYHGKGTRVVNMGEMFAFDKLPDIEMSRIELTEDELQKSCVLKDDLLFARRSLVAEGAGKCTLVLSQKEPLTFESSIIRARPNQKKAKSEYLFYLFTSKFGKYLLKTILRQVAVSGITGVDLINLKLPIAPLKEQEEIVSILSCLDAKIENLRRQNETLEQIAQTLFKHWFIDFEFPNADGKPYKSSGGAMSPSELGDIPEGWRVGKLKDISDITSSKRIFSAEYVETGIPFYRSKEIIELHAGQNVTTELYISKEKFNEIKSKFEVPKVGEILLTSVGTIGIPYLIRKNDEFYFKDGNLTWIKNFKNGFAGVIIYYWIKSDSTQNKIKQNTIGSTQKALTIQALGNISIFIPDTNILSKYRQFIEIVNSKVENNLYQIQTLTKTRDALLPKLMSGQLRIKE
ncbi:MAG: restriction endonuclease subunit S [Aphanizomenon sp.]|jgi:type I restriction enzyme S subunit